jgi:hypothetical protein
MGHGRAQIEPQRPEEPPTPTVPPAVKNFRRVSSMAYLRVPLFTEQLCQRILGKEEMLRKSGGPRTVSRYSPTIDLADRRTLHTFVPLMPTCANRWAGTGHYPKPVAFLVLPRTTTEAGGLTACPRLLLSKFLNLVIIHIRIKLRVSTMVRLCRPHDSRSPATRRRCAAETPDG